MCCGNSGSEVCQHCRKKSSGCEQNPSASLQTEMCLLQEAEEKSCWLLRAVFSRPVPDCLPRELCPGCRSDDAAR